MPEHCEAIDANVFAMAEGLHVDEALEGAKVTKTLRVSEMTLACQVASVISADSGQGPEQVRRDRGLPRDYLGFLEVELRGFEPLTP